MRAELGEEVHLERVRELRRRAEGEVHVLVQHLRDVRPRDLHPTRELRLRDAKLLHPQQYLPQKRRSYPIYRFHIFQSKPLRALHVLTCNFLMASHICFRYWESWSLGGLEDFYNFLRNQSPNLPATKAINLNSSVEHLTQRR